MYVTTDNNYGPPQFLVDPVAGKGTHTTIAAACASATSGQTIYVRANPSAYTENFTIPAGVNVVSAIGNAFGGVVIKGKITMTAAGISTVAGCTIQTNGDYCVEVTGAAALQLNLSNCLIFAADHTAIHLTNSNTSSQIQVRNCFGDVGLAGASVFVQTGAQLSFLYSYFGNGIFSTGLNTNSGGETIYEYAIMSNGTSITGTGTFGADKSRLDCGAAGVVALNVTSTAQPANCSHCTMTSGTATAMTVGAGATIVSIYCDLWSNQAGGVAVSGAGTNVLASQVYAQTATTNNAGIVTLLTHQGP